MLVPLWRRRVRRSRLLLLDAPLGDGLCLYDLVADRANLSDACLGTAIHDDRLVRIMQHLTPEERLVVIALATGDGTTWTEATAHAGASEPAAFGERVRRKTRRLAVRAEERRAAARATSASALAGTVHRHGDFCTRYARCSQGASSPAHSPWRTHCAYRSVATASARPFARPRLRHWRLSLRPEPRRPDRHRRCHQGAADLAAVILRHRGKR